jgi:hypothetical protein
MINNNNKNNNKCETKLHSRAASERKKRKKKDILRKYPVAISRILSFYLSAASSLSTYLSAHLTSQKAPRLFTWLLKIAL